MIDPYPSLHQTVHVSSDRSWLGIGAEVPNGTVTHGIDVPHEAVNIECGHIIGEWVAEGVHYPKRCRKRAGHDTPKDAEQHVAQDMRIIASPPHVAHTQRFAPNLIPGGVDQIEVTIPHNCDNHLPDTVEVLRRGW